MQPSFARAALAIARKDLQIELRTRTAFFSALVFVLLAIVVMYFAWDPATVSTSDRAPGAIWVIFVFSGLLGLNRAFNMESHDGALSGLLLAPVSREAIYAGKALANLIFVGSVQVVAIPATFFFLNAGFGMHLVYIGVLVAFATVGLVGVGTLFSAMATNTRLAEILLPLLALPFLATIIIPAALATSRLVAGRPFSEVVGQVQMLAAFDLVFVFAAALAFPFTLEE